MHQLTAAHLTLPLNSIARVTNVATGESVRVRITDRGPFVADRIIDLSMEAAKRISLYRQGVAKVKVEVLQSPASIGQGGRWAVQIGAFGDEDTATQMKDKLERRYHTAKVLDFKGPRHEHWAHLHPPKGKDKTLLGAIRLGVGYDFTPARMEKTETTSITPMNAGREPPNARR